MEHANLWSGVYATSHFKVTEMCAMANEITGMLSAMRLTSALNELFV